MNTRRLYTIERGELDRLIKLLRGQEYQVVAPTVQDDVIVYDEIEEAHELPIGWTDVQSPGRYRLKKRGDDQYFGFVVGPHSWKKYVFPPRLSLFGVTQETDTSGGFQVAARTRHLPKYAFIGARACELAALGIQDKVLSGDIADPYYQEVRQNAFIVAVNCLEPAGTCFCASMGAGPQCERDFDLCLTELNGHFAVEIGSEAGAAIFKPLTSREADATSKRLYQLLMDRARDHMGRKMETDGLPQLLKDSLNSPRWDQIAKRCLACANCTMVCPTCFCYNVTDHTDLTGHHAERVGHWGSCFTLEFTYMVGKSIRTSGSSRYRQWMTHKLSTWHEQFGTSGCVGCGRCITWCPMGIDITEEAAAFRRDAALHPANPEPATTM